MCSSAAAAASPPPPTIAPRQRSSAGRCIAPRASSSSGVRAPRTTGAAPRTSSRSLPACRTALQQLEHVEPHERVAFGEQGQQGREHAALEQQRALLLAARARLRPHLEHAQRGTAAWLGVGLGVGVGVT